MIKAVIFDMDGVVIDSEPIQSMAFKNVLTEYGVGPISEPIVHVPGMRARENLEIVKARYGLNEEIDVLVEKREKAYLNLLKDNVRSREGFLPLLKLLKDNNYKVGLGTSSTVSVKVVLAGLGIEEAFDAIVTGFDVTNAKPDPEVFLKVADRLKAKAAECLVIEDSGAGVEAAKRAGMKCIAVPNDFTRDQDLTKADLIVSSLEEIDLAVIERLAGSG